jgi:hypothetical protein
MEIRSCHSMSHSLACTPAPPQDTRPLYYHHKNKKTGAGLKSDLTLTAYIFLQ